MHFYRIIYYERFLQCFFENVIDSLIASISSYGLEVVENYIRKIIQTKRLKNEIKRQLSRVNWIFSLKNSHLIIFQELIAFKEKSGKWIAFKIYVS